MMDITTLQGLVKTKSQEIDFLWDDQSRPIEIRGKLINKLAKERNSLERQILAIHLRDLGLIQ